MGVVGKSNGEKSETRGKARNNVLKCPFQTFAYYWGDRGRVQYRRKEWFCTRATTCVHTSFFYRKKRGDCSRRKKTGKFEGFENKHVEREGKAFFVLIFIVGNIVVSILQFSFFFFFHNGNNIANFSQPILQRCIILH